MGPLRVGAEAVADRLRFLNSAFAIRRSKFPWPDRRRRQKLLNDLRSRFFRPAGACSRASTSRASRPGGRVSTFGWT